MSEEPTENRGRGVSEEPTEDNTRPDKPDDVMDGVCPIDGTPFAVRPYQWDKAAGKWSRARKTRKTCTRSCGSSLRHRTSASTPGASASTPGASASTPGEVQHTDMVFTVKITRRTVCGMTPDEVAEDMTKVVRGMLSSLNRIEADVTEVTGRRVSARWVPRG